MHLCWAAIIMVDDSALNATALHAIYRYLGSSLLVAEAVFFSALLALVGIATNIPWVILLLIPQQVLLMMSAGGVTEAIWIAQFADGVVRPRAFIAADQLYVILAAIGHTLAIIFHIKRGRDGPTPS